MQKVRFGVDLGGTSCAIGAVNEQGKVGIKKSFMTEGVKSGDAITYEIAWVVNKLKEEIGKDTKFLGVGIGAPGDVDSKKKSVIYAPNLPFRNQSFATIEEMTGLGVEITNDANAAALGEATFGAAKDYDDSVTITLGTGVGGGVVHNKKIFEGKTVNTELGHMPIMASAGEQCGCGQRGCWEAYASATALIRDIKRAMLLNPHSVMWGICGIYSDEAHKLCWLAAKGKGQDMPYVTPKLVFEAEKLGDQTAKEIVQNYINYVGAGSRGVINAFGPQALIFGGGVSEQGDNLLGRVQKHIDASMFGGAIKKGQPSKVKVLKAALGNDAGIVGGASLVKEDC
jgi:glucokinase